MKILECTNCGFTASHQWFTDYDEFWSCPVCGMDESGLDEFPVWRFDGATVQAYVLWPVERENDWVLSVTPVVETATLDRYSRLTIERDGYKVMLSRSEQIVKLKITAMAVDISGAQVQN